MKVRALDSQILLTTVGLCAKELTSLLFKPLVGVQSHRAVQKYRQRAANPAINIQQFDGF
jgi:hypothetical protein